MSLDERLPGGSGLDECVGLGAPLGFGSVDWNALIPAALEGVSNCQPPNNTNVSADINRDNARTALPGFNDWANIFFNFRSLSSFGNDSLIHPVLNEPDSKPIEDSSDGSARCLRPASVSASAARRPRYQARR